MLEKNKVKIPIGYISNYIAKRVLSTYYDVISIDRSRCFFIRTAVFVHVTGLTYICRAFFMSVKECYNVSLILSCKDD